MKFGRRHLAGLAAVALTAGVAVTITVPAESAQSTVTATPPGAVHTVTLVTGDRVTFSSDGGKVSAEPGPGRDGITFDITTDSGTVRVVPSDAGPLLAAGRLDARLFDVTGLVAAGYDREDELPLIVTGGLPRAGGLAATRDLPAVNGTAVRQQAATAADSWHALRTNRSTGKVWLDGMRQTTLDVSVPQVGAPAAWEAGYTGEGVTVAVLDSGIDGTHPDLAGQVAAQQNFTEGYESDEDLVGHGTHVAATIAGTGTGRHKGVAPGAKLLDGKVCVDGGCADSWIIAGMTWAAAEQDADVVNMSLGGMDDPTSVDPVEEAVGTLSEQYGTLFVIAAGNTDGGVAEGVIGSPGTAQAALTVGSVDRDEKLADSSRRGPTGDNRMKPDITAPGVDITAARSKDSPGGAGDQYLTLSGTSMATPHVAGAAAIMAQRNPGWDGQRVKAALVGSARPNPEYGVYAQGGGRLDVARAVGQTVTGSRSVDFGARQWPHDDDAVESREVTYRNDGPAAVTLDLELPDAPAGMFTLSADSVDVPAGGEATVTVTADTRVAGPDGHVGGWLTATGGDQVVRTPVGVVKEVESYDITLNHVDRNGATPMSFSSNLAPRDSRAPVIGWRGPDPGGSVTLRVPAGHYTLMSSVFTAQPNSDITPTLLSQPDLHVDRTMTIDLDARLGQPISMAVGKASAKQVWALVGAYTYRPGGTAGQVIAAESFANVFAGRIGPDTVDDRFFSDLAGQWARANADGTTDDSPYFYSLFFPLKGRMVHGYQRTVADKDLAAVRADFARTQPGTRGSQAVHGGLLDNNVGFFGPGVEFQLPFTRTEYYNTDARFIGQFSESSADGSYAGAEAMSYTRYDVGQTYRERWNTGVFAPTVPALSLSGWVGVARTGNRVWLDMPMYGDGTGRGGYSSVTASGATLFRDGVRVGETDGTRFSSIDVPAGEAAYRLEMRSERGAALSTETDIAWTFRSGQTSAQTALPLWTVRFSPNVDQHNSVRGGVVHAVPVKVTPQPDAVVGSPSSLTVEASFDDGTTWRKVPVVGGAAKIPHPRGDGFVSLRATAADSAGNTVTQTVIRAYRQHR